MNFIVCFSASLNQLDGDDESDDDDSYHDAKEDNHSPNRQNPLGMDALSISPSESGGSSPFCKLRFMRSSFPVIILWSMYFVLILQKSSN